MDVNDMRVAVTLISLALFIGIMLWTWAPRQRRGFDEAARLPFLDEEAQAGRQGEAP